MPQKVGFRWKCRLAHFTLFCDAWHQHGCRGGLGVCSYYRTLYDKYHNRNLLSCALMSCGNTATLSSLLSFECVHTLTQVARWSGGRMSNVVFRRWGNVRQTLSGGRMLCSDIEATLAQRCLVVEVRMLCTDVEATLAQHSYNVGPTSAWTLSTRGLDD